MMWSVCSLCEAEGCCVSPQCPVLGPVLSYVSMLSLSWSKAGQLSSLPVCPLSQPEGRSCSLVSCRCLDLTCLLGLFSIRLHRQSNHTQPDLHLVSFKPPRNFTSLSLMSLYPSWCLRLQSNRVLNQTSLPLLVKFTVDVQSCHRFYIIINPCLRMEHFNENVLFSLLKF